ncbi:MAG TPA: HNH endonuclease signature motif containing protein [Rhodopila sp.]
MAGKLKTLAPMVVCQDVRIARPGPKVADPFYLSLAWRSLMSRLIAERGRRCADCGRTHNLDGSSVRIFGDHVRELRDGGAPLDPTNVRLLCGSCHSLKTAKARAARMTSS